MNVVANGREPVVGRRWGVSVPIRNHDYQKPVDQIAAFGSAFVAEAMPSLMLAALSCNWAPDTVPPLWGGDGLQDLLEILEAGRGGLVGMPVASSKKAHYFELIQELHVLHGEILSWFQSQQASAANPGSWPKSFADWCSRHPEVGQLIGRPPGPNIHQTLADDVPLRGELCTACAKLSRHLNGAHIRYLPQTTLGRKAGVFVARLMNQGVGITSDEVISDRHELLKAGKSALDDDGDTQVTYLLDTLMPDPNSDVAWRERWRGNWRMHQGKLWSGLITQTILAIEGRGEKEAQRRDGQTGASEARGFAGQSSLITINFREGTIHFPQGDDVRLCDKSLLLLEALYIRAMKRNEGNRYIPFGEVFRWRVATELRTSLATELRTSLATTFAAAHRSREDVKRVVLSKRNLGGYVLVTQGLKFVHAPAVSEVHLPSGTHGVVLGAVYSGDPFGELKDGSDANRSSSSSSPDNDDFDGDSDGE